jgi:hypothetical protein
MQRSPCRFKIARTPEGRAEIRVELFHQTVPALEGSVLSFELLAGISGALTTKLVDELNEKIVTLQITTGNG